VVSSVAWGRHGMDLHAECPDRTCEVVYEILPGSRRTIHLQLLWEAQRLARQSAVEETHSEMCPFDVGCALPQEFQYLILVTKDDA
jgi:hypothetical protein